MTLPTWPGIHPVGVALALGLTAALFLHRAGRSGLARGVAFDVAIAGVAGALAGARLMGWMLDPGAPVVASVSWGADLGGAAAAIAVLIVRRVPIAPVFDLAAPAMMAGVAVARVGCFLAGEEPGTLVLLYLALGAALVAVVGWRRSHRLGPGGTAALVVAGYAAGRLLLEPLRREPAESAVGFAAAALAAGVALAGWSRLTSRRTSGRSPRSDPSPSPTCPPHDGALRPRSRIGTG